VRRPFQENDSTKTGVHGLKGPNGLFGELRLAASIITKQNVAQRGSTMDQAFALGIDLGGTTIKAGVYDDKWKLLECVSIDTRVNAGPEAVVGDMAQAAKKLMAHHSFRPAAIGLGSPGPLDLEQGQLMSLPNFPGWDFFPIREALSNAVGVPVILESDGNTAALAELKMGAGKDCDVDSLCMWTLGTGVGSGLILNGKVWHGRSGMAGELGHVCVDPNGASCMCGSQGCLERFVSATAIAATGRKWLQENDSADALRGRDVQSFTTRDFARMAEAGHRGMQAMFDEVGYYLGLSIASTINMLDLPLYVVGGGVADAWALFAKSLFQSVAKHSYVYELSRPCQDERYESGSPFITRAMLGPQAGLLGAALISVEAV
jgi:glucokinase